MALLSNVGFGSNHGQPQREKFADVPRPVALAATTQRLLTASIGLTCEAGVVSFDSNGVPTPFLTVPNSGGECHRGVDIAISPYVAFGEGFVYLQRNNAIHKIDPATRHATGAPFAIIDRAAAIAFDRIGSFGKSLLVATDRGAIYALRPDGRGSDAPIGTLGAGQAAGELDVAPWSFGAYGGDLIIANLLSASTNREAALYALDPQSSRARPIQESMGMENPGDVKFVPHTSCTFGSSGGTLFNVDTSSDRVNKFRLEGLSQLRDSAILFGHHNVRHPDDPELWTHSEFLMSARNGAGQGELEITPFLQETSRELPVIEEGAFVPCPTDVSVGDVFVPEGDEGTTMGRFEVRLQIANNEPVRVDYRTQDPPVSLQAATKVVDYSPVEGHTIFDAGETVKTVEVPIVGDALPEPDEKFLLTAGEPCIVAPDSPGLRCALADTAAAQGTGTILNDDDLPLTLPEIAPPGVELPGLKLTPDHVPPEQPPMDSGPVMTGPAISGSAPPAFAQVSQAPPAPPSGAPAPGPLGVPAGVGAPGSTPLSVPAGSAASTLVQVPVPGAAPPLVAAGQGTPVAIPGLQSSREQEPKAAPESDYAMAGGVTEGLAGRLIFTLGAFSLLFVACGIASRSGQQRQHPAAGAVSL